MTEDASAPPSSSPAPSPKRWPWIVALIVLAAVAATALWLWTNRDQILPQSLHSKPVIAVEQPASPPILAQPDLDQIKGQLQRLEQSQLQVDVSGLEERIAHLEKSGADAASVLRLVDRIDRLEASLRELQTRRKADAALVLAVGLLKDAVDRGASFDAELRALKALAPEDEDVKKLVTDLKGRAAAGIPPRTVLTTRFQGLEAAIIRAEALPTAQDGIVDDWQRRALERLMTVFTVRREDGDVEGNSTAAIVARTREALARNDWTGAVRTAESLTGEGAKKAEPWLDDAKARLLADQEIADLAAQAVAAAGAKL